MDNIYKAYADNIAPLTPIIADRMKLAEEDYGSKAIMEAIETAVMRNARNWNYIEAILKNGKNGKRFNKNADTHATDAGRLRYGEWEK